MKKTLLHHCVTFCLVVGIFFSVANRSYADTLTLPKEYAYPGLTFSRSLTYTKTTTITAPTTSIAFTPQNKLAITNPSPTKPIETIILTPTTAPVQPTPPPTIPPYSPTPQVAGGLNADDLWAKVNAYRQSNGLPAFQQDAKTCSLAQTRAPQVGSEIAAGTMHSGLKAMNLPYWNTENVISMNSDQAAFTWWLNDPIHHAAIVSHATYSCIACSGNSCAEEFTSYQPK